jgi:SAM-dependent methyltransferase
MTKDLMFQQEIREAVARTYAEIPTGGGDGVTRRSYTDEELAELPHGATAWALGVGNPVRSADLQPGEVVLDVGSGGGIDTILAAKRVGPEGRVIGLDLLDEMRKRADENVAEAGVDGWVEVRRGEMESIPLEDDSVDVAISNGVINLSPRKSRTLAELRRVLRPGGRFCVVDLIVDEDLPPTVLGSTAAWAGCISGALSEDVLVRKLQNAGFEDVWVGQRIPVGLNDLALYPLFTQELLDEMRAVMPAGRHGHVATSVLVKARVP